MKLSDFLFFCFVTFTFVTIFGYLLPQAIRHENEMKANSIENFINHEVVKNDK